MTDDKPKIIVDENWKEEARKEKEKLAENAAAKQESERQPLPKPEFLTHITSLATQSLIFLGVVANPMTGQAEFDPEQARFIIDSIAMLMEKTKGNLSEQEEQTGNSIVSELKMAWVQATGGQPSKEDEESSSPE
ncbi:MAG: DUF1844 domain-containing protein [Planctomycetota bacterium]|jgi:hypothetical protein